MVKMPINNDPSGLIALLLIIFFSFLWWGGEPDLQDMTACLVYQPWCEVSD